MADILWLLQQNVPIKIRAVWCRYNRIIASRGELWLSFPLEKTLAMPHEPEMMHLAGVPARMERIIQ